MISPIEWAILIDLCAADKRPLRTDGLSAEGLEFNTPRWAGLFCFCEVSGAKFFWRSLVRCSLSAAKSLRVAIEKFKTKNGFGFFKV